MSYGIDGVLAPALRNANPGRVVNILNGKLGNLPHCDGPALPAHAG
jgi:hypothetical protein